MRSVVSATEARVHFGELLRRVGEDGETVFVERGGSLQVVVLSLPVYERLVSGLEPGGWRERVRQARDRLRAELGGAALPAAEDVIRAGREERDERVGGLR
jgi:prevent-host-death family protein